MENCVGGTSQLWKPSVAGGVTGLYEGLVGLGVTGALVVIGCFVGLGVLAAVGLGVADFERLTFDVVGLKGASFRESGLGLDGVAFDDVTLDLEGVLLALVGWGFFGTAPWSNNAGLGFVLEGLVLVLTGIVGFFELLAPTLAFFGLF